MIDHIGFEVSDLARSARFYDAVLYALGARRLIQSEHVVAYGINAPQVWIVTRGRVPAPGYGHVALQASGKAAVDAAYAGGLANGGDRRRRSGDASAVRRAALRGIPARPRRPASRGRLTEVTR